MKQTAVEWLENQLRKKHTLTTDDIKDIEEAKAMEKEHIETTFDDGYGMGYIDNGKLGRQYYKETFKSE